MSGIITRNFRLHNTSQFKEMFTETEGNNLYFFVSRNTPWPDDANPPTPTDNVNDVEYKVWNNMLAMKRITSTDVSFAAPRYDWTSGTTYAEYRADNNFSANNFFVLTDDYNIYKCVFNDSNALSTVKPTGTSSSIFSTNDGYKWKFMGQVTAADALKFLTTTFIPVSTLTANNGSFQWIAQQAASNGSIETISVVTPGSGYKFNSGTIFSANTSTAVLGPSAEGTNDVYNGSTIYLASGTGAGQIRTINNYDGAAKRITVSSVFSPAPDATTTYIVGPKVNVTGDGTGLAAYANVASGVLRYITVTNKGSNYSFANVSITANSTNGSGGVVSPNISPKGGHGRDIVNELYAHNLILNIKTSGTESNTFFTSNDFRTMGLILDPILLANGAVASGTSYRMTKRIVVTSPSGTPAADEKFTGGVSGAKAFFVERANTTVLFFTGYSGNFTNGETITGATSGATAVVSSTGEPQIKPYTGKVIYFENRAPIARSTDQAEDIKFIVRF
jgi:hypothetical protein